MSHDRSLLVTDPRRCEPKKCVVIELQPFLEKPSLFCYYYVFTSIYLLNVEPKSCLNNFNNAVQVRWSRRSCPLSEVLPLKSSPLAAAAFPAQLPLGCGLLTVFCRKSHWMFEVFLPDSLPSFVFRIVF